MEKVIDVRVGDEGSIVSFEIVTQAAKDWVKENVATESWQWMGDRLCVEWRMAQGLIEGMKAAGLQVA